MSSEKPDLADLTATVLSAGKAVKAAEEKANAAAYSGPAKIVQFPEPEFREETGPPEDYEDEARGGQRERIDTEPPKSESESAGPVNEETLFGPDDDLMPLLEGKIVRPRPDVGPVGENGRCIFYSKSVNEIHGSPGDGKTNVGTAVIIAIAKSASSALVLDPEDSREGFMLRLRSLCQDDPEVLQAVRDKRIRYLHDPEPEKIKKAQRWATEQQITLVIFDGLAEMIAAEGLNEDVAGDVLKFFRQRVRPFAEKAGAAVLVVDHTGKVSASEGWARGSSAKKGRYDGVSYSLELGRAYSPEVAGFLRLKVRKDRKGGAGEKNVHTWNLHFAPGKSEGYTEIQWEDLKAQRVADPDQDAPANKPTVLMDRVVEYLQQYPGATAGALDKAQLGAKAGIQWAIRCLVKERRIRVEVKKLTHRHFIVAEDEKPSDFDPAGYREERSPNNTEKTQ